MKKIFLTLLICMFLASFVIAQPPFQVSEPTTGYELVFPKFYYHQIDKDFYFCFHVFNISNGMPIDNSSTSCNFHLYNKTGHSIILEETLGVNSDHLFTWILLVDKGNFSYPGQYSYLVHCNSSDLGGFVSAPFTTTPTGEHLTESKSNLLIGSFFILIVTTIFFLVLGLFAKNTPFKIFFIGLSIIFIVGTLGFSVSVWQQIFGTLGTLVSTYGNIFILLTILLIGGGIGLIVYLVYLAIMSFWNNCRGISKDD